MGEARGQTPARYLLSIENNKGVKSFCPLSLEGRGSQGEGERG